MNPHVERASRDARSDQDDRKTPYTIADEFVVSFPFISNFYIATWTKTWTKIGIWLESGAPGMINRGTGWMEVITVA